MKENLLNANKNATYLSLIVQNEVIEVCAQTVREKLVQRINASGCFSLLADESMDISTTEQVSLCVRFVETDNFKKAIINEHFLCFVPIVDQTANNVTSVILQTTARLGLNLDLLVGQGYDGASTFSGCRSGVAVQIVTISKSLLRVLCKPQTKSCY